MGRRGRAAGCPARGTTGIILEFAKPGNGSQPGTSTSNATTKKTEAPSTAKSVVPTGSNNPSPIFADEAEGHYERCTSKSCEKESVERLINFWNTATQRRKDLYSVNSNPNYEEFEALRRNKKLDSTLKRCSAFVKKLKNCWGQQAEAASKEAEVLNLTKYLSEICTALTENRLKDRNHIWDIISICSKLHQRYQEFAPALMEIYKVKFSCKVVDCDWNIMGSDLRLVTEFIVCGILGDDAFPLMIQCLRHLVVYDKDTSAHMNIMLLFAKEFGLDVAGIFPKCVQILCDTFSIGQPSSDIISGQRRLKAKYLINDYMGHVCSNLTKLHDEVINSQLICRKLLKTKGEVFKDREDLHKDLMANFERFHGMAKKLAFYTDACLPELKELPPDEVDEDIPIFGDDGAVETVSRSTFFDDEETRSFYQDLPDLTKYLTNAAKRENTLLLEKQAAALAEAEANLDVESEIAELQSEAALANTEGDLDTETVAAPSHSNEGLVAEEEKSDEVLPPKFHEYLLALRNCVNRSMIDDYAEMFMCNFNTKPNRKKLIKELNYIPRQRVDLLPLWSRLIAILNPVVPEIGAEVTDFLKREMWILLKRCHPTFIESKLKVTRYIAELVNFEIFPPIDAFNCLRNLLSNFSHHQLEMACIFVESCGRYLYKNPATKRRMKLYMDLMVRKKQAKALDPRYADLVEQAILAVYPPVGGQKKKRIPIMEAFLMEHVYIRLSRKTLEATLIFLRKLNWSNHKDFAIALKIFTQPWMIAKNSFGLTCGLLSRLEDYQPTFVMNVTDSLLLQVLHGLSHIETLNNQHLVSMITFICDLFCYQMYTCDSILKLLYAVISKGAATTYKKPTRLDPPRSSFRLRLVTVILAGCGDYFLDDKNSKHQLKFFLYYLQRYMYFKAEDPAWEKAHTPYSFEPFQVVEDLIAHLFPKMKLCKTFEAACEKIAEMELKVVKHVPIVPVKSAEPMTEPRSQAARHLHKIQECEEGSEERIGKSKWAPRNRLPQSAFGRESVAEPFYGGAGNFWGNGEDEMEEECEADDEFAEATPEEGMDFDRQLGRLCADSGAHRYTRVVNTDIRIPLNLEKNTKRVMDEAEELPTGTISYAILLKKGNKANVKHVDVPENSEFVKKMKDREAIEREEKAQIKAKTLGIKRLQDHEEMQLQLSQLQFQFAKK